MENHDLVEYKVDYYIVRYDKDDESIKIDEQEFKGLSNMLALPDVRFVQLRDDRIISVNSIKEVIKVARKQNTEAYAETGANPYFREWCSLGKDRIPFKEWVKKQTER